MYTRGKVISEVSEWSSGHVRIQVAYGKIPHVARGRGMHARKISFVGGVCDFLQMFCGKGTGRHDF